MDVGIGNRPPAALLAGDLVEARTLLFGTVEVVVALEPRGDGGLHERVAQLVGVPAVLDVQRTVGAVVGVAEPGVALGLLEVRKHVVVAPAGRAIGVAPLVIVGAVAAHVDHGVVRRAAAESLHAGPVRPAATEMFLRGRLVAPVPLGLEQREPSDGEMDHVVVVLGPSFEQQHRYARILAQPRSNDSARAARSDDDVVEAFLGHNSPCGRARSTSQNLLPLQP